jgi:hypothetical protein
MAIRPLNSVAGFSVGETPTNIILANGDITTTNITTTGVSNLNSVGNVKISGGSAGQVISTDGSGNLSFITVSTAGLSNGTSNIAILNNGNITFSVGGNANVAIVTGTGINVAGTLNATGNANVGNIGATNGVFTNVSGNGASLSAITGANVTGQVSFAATANSVAGANVSGEVGFAAVANSVAGANVSGQVGNALVAGTVYTAAQPNITSVGTLTSLGVNGNITAANITANTGVFTGNGSGLSAIAGANVTGTVANATYATSAGTATTAGSATTAGTVTTNAQPNITSVGTLTSLSVTGNANVGNIGATNGVFTNVSGNGSALSSITGANVTGEVSFAATANSVAGANVSGQVANALVAGTVYTAAQPNITSVGTLSSLTVTGNVVGGNVYANSGTIGATTLSASGNVNAANANITANLIANYITASNGLQISNGALTVSAGNLDVTGNINVTGNLNYSNVTDLVVGDPLIYIGANNTGDLYDLGIVASYNNGTYYHTGIARNHTTDYWTFFDGVVEEPTTVVDWANATYPTVQLGNLIATANANIGGYANVVGNITAGNINAGNLLTANFVTGTLTTNAQPNITSVGTLTSLAVTGNGTFGNVYANSGIIGAQTLKGEGGNISNIQGANVSGTVSSATTAGTVTTAAQPNITSVGTLTGLSVNGNITAANITANTGRFSGNGSGLTSLTGANVTGQVANALVAGTVYTAAQPNITSVGTLTSLGVNGNITAANITANTGRFSGNGSGLTNIAGANVTGQVGNALVAGTVYTAAQPNITSVGTLTSLTVSGNANVGNIGATNFVGSGASLTSLNASNLASGTVPSARLSGTYTINISGSATTAGTVTTAAQPNITSVGTLSSLTVSGNVSTGNISGTNGNLTTANISGNLIIGNASVTTAISYGSVTTTAVTANQTIASFSATGVTGVEFLVKSIDSAGSKYGVATVVAVTDGTNVDYSTFATVNLGGYTGALAVNIVGGQVRLQVTPASSNSTVWTTQMRLL